MICKLFFFSFFFFHIFFFSYRTPKCVGTLKSDGHTNVRWSAPKPDGLTHRPVGPFVTEARWSAGSRQLNENNFSSVNYQEGKCCKSVKYILFYFTLCYSSKIFAVKLRKQFFQDFLIHYLSLWFPMEYWLSKLLSYLARLCIGKIQKTKQIKK